VERIGRWLRGGGRAEKWDESARIKSGKSWGSVGFLNLLSTTYVDIPK